MNRLYCIGIIFFIVFSFSFSYDHIIVEISKQKLYYYANEDIRIEYDISTSKNGIGNLDGSYKTPLGKHEIVSMIGDGAQIGEIFIARRKTGKISKIYKDPIDIDEDYIVTRIMRLKGLEKGKNVGGKIDSFKRNIYIHGTPEEGLIGTPSSEGCIRMRNEDVIELFELVSVGTLVEIIK